MDCDRLSLLLYDAVVDRIGFAVHAPKTRRSGTAALSARDYILTSA